MLFFARRHVFGYFAFLLVGVELESHKNIAEHYILRGTNNIDPSYLAVVCLFFKAPKLYPGRKLELGLPSQRVINIQVL